MSKKNLRKPAPAQPDTTAQPAVEPAAPAPTPMSDADALNGAIQLLNYAADAGAFASNPKLWGPKAQILDRLAVMAVKAHTKG